MWGGKKHYGFPADRIKQIERWRTQRNMKEENYNNENTNGDTGKMVEIQEGIFRLPNGNIYDSKKMTITDSSTGAILSVSTLK